MTATPQEAIDLACMSNEQVVNIPVHRGLASQPMRRGRADSAGSRRRRQLMAEPRWTMDHDADANRKSKSYGAGMPSPSRNVLLQLQ
jgi:hypothetical protein